jgi:hypothetical protein
VSAIAHVLEAAGIPTTGISLVRPHSEKMNAPRALWTSFELGRPFGVPDQPAFQRDVLFSALRLLARMDGPVLEDYPHDAPEQPAEDETVDEGWACPVSFDIPVVDDRDELVKAAEREIRSLEPWYRMGVERRGRTTVGLSGLDIDGCLESLSVYAGTGAVPVDGKARNEAEMLRFCIEDVKAWYQEAATARPGSPSTRQIMHWLWDETVMATLLKQVRERTAESDDKAVRTVGERQLAPSALGH